MIDRDLASGKHQHVVTRFPPEPNGYLHIGHAKAICVSFGIAADYEGRCHLRFDDTNPTAEDVEYVESIMNDVRWLGFDWGEHLYFASDYFEQMYAWAQDLIRDGLAYVDSQSVEDVREQRGSFDTPGTNGPFRDRSVEENLDLFARMRAGEFPDGAHVLRAKIDMADPNMVMRDPLLYRIRHAHHHRQGDKWCIYPMYDYAHCLEDAIEGVTHSLCTLEFENNRELYDWIIEKSNAPKTPNQTEFARLGLGYTVMSKRKLLRLVKDGLVTGWDDPRMPTIAGLRRRGVRAEAIRAFADLVGVSKNNSTVDIGKFEYCVRDDLNTHAPRRMAVVDPLKVTITNLDAGVAETFDAASFPDDIGKPGSREVSFSNTLYIEQSDFAMNPPKGFYRLSPGGIVRLRYASYYLQCDEVVLGGDGSPVELKCSYLTTVEGRVKGTIHWVDAATSLPAEFRIYDRLFTEEFPEADPEVDFLENLNKASLVVAKGFVEASVGADAAESHYQFERNGYFYADPEDHREGRLVYNRTMTLKDAWSRRDAKAAPPKKHKRKVKQSGAPTKSASHERDARRAADPALAATFTRLMSELGVAKADADVLTADAKTAAFAEATIRAGASPKAAAKWVINEVRRVAKDGGIGELKFKPQALATLVTERESGRITAAAAKTVFEQLAATGEDPIAIIKAHGFDAVQSEDALGGIIDEVMAAHAAEVARFRGGEQKLQGFFIGKVMRAVAGKASAGDVRKALLAKLEG